MVRKRVKPADFRPQTQAEKSDIRRARKLAAATTAEAGSAVNKAYVAKMEEFAAVTKAQKRRRESARLITDLFHHRKALTLLAIEMRRLGITDKDKLADELKRLDAEIAETAKGLNDSRFKPSEQGYGTARDPTTIRFLGDNPITPF